MAEPGFLQNFFTEFDILEGFFDKAELSAGERSQRAFDANCLTKARDKSEPFLNRCLLPTCRPQLS